MAINSVDFGVSFLNKVKVSRVAIVLIRYTYCLSVADYCRALVFVMDENANIPIYQSIK